MHGREDTTTCGASPLFHQASPVPWFDRIVETGATGLFSFRDHPCYGAGVVDDCPPFLAAVHQIPCKNPDFRSRKIFWNFFDIAQTPSQWGVHKNCAIAPVHGLWAVLRAFWHRWTIGCKCKQ
jgi:hypothetical protein